MNSNPNLPQHYNHLAYGGLNDNLNGNLEINPDDNNDPAYINTTRPVDISKYTLAPEETEMNKYINVMNIFMCYYKQLFRCKQDSTMFDQIDYSHDSNTNRCMEFMFEHMAKYNKSTNTDRDVLYDPDTNDVKIDDVDELYMLSINNEPLYVSTFLLPLIEYLASAYNAGDGHWSRVDWSIMALKN